MSVYLGVVFVPGKKFQSIKRPRVYEGLRRDGKSKEQAARIANSPSKRKRKKS